MVVLGGRLFLMSEVHHPLVRRAVVIREMHGEHDQVVHGHQRRAPRLRV